MEALKEFSVPFERSHKPKEDRAEGVRKFVGGRDGKKFGSRPGGFRKRFDNDSKEANPNTEKAIDKISL
jgi:hypothetical protein